MYHKCENKVLLMKGLLDGFFFLINFQQNFLRMERRRSQKSQMRANVSEQSVVLDSGARVPESEVSPQKWDAVTMKRHDITSNYSLGRSSSILFHILGGRWSDGGLDEHRSWHGWTFFLRISCFCYSTFDLRWSLCLTVCEGILSHLILMLVLINDWMKSVSFNFEVFFHINFWRDGNIAKK